jgi:LacI family transcriptional regulator
MSAVAADAGVSTITVSRVFRRHPSVRPETDAKVRASAERLGYRPDPLVGILMARLRSGMPGSARAAFAIVNLLPEPMKRHSSPRIRALYDGIVSRAASLGFVTSEFRVGDAPGALTPARLNSILGARGIVGVIVAIAPGIAFALPLDWSRLAAVAVGFTVREPSLHRVAPDHYHNMLALCQHLHDRGCRRIGFCVDRNSAERTDYLWIAGLRSHQEHALAAKRINPLILDDFYSQESRSVISNWARDQKLDAMISNHDQGKEFTSAKHPGMANPITFAHLDRAPDAINCAGIDQRFSDVGAAAVDVVIGQLHRNERGVPLVPRTLLVPGRLVC